MLPTNLDVGANFLSIDGLMDIRQRMMDMRALQLLLLIWCLSLCDLFLTIWAHVYTPFREVNPLARLMLSHHHYGILAAFKIVMTFAGTTLFYRLRNHERAQTALWGMSICYLLLMVKWWQYTHGTVMLGYAS